VLTAQKFLSIYSDLSDKAHGEARNPDRVAQVSWAAKNFSERGDGEDERAAA
jgi:hypothetical protein